jgi:hypothetical protein
MREAERNREAATTERSCYVSCWSSIREVIAISAFAIWAFDGEWKITKDSYNFKGKKELEV